MKSLRLLVVVVDPQHKGAMRRLLAEENLGATLVESTGGFLRGGSATFLMAMDDDRVDAAIEAIRSVVAPVEREGEEGRKAVVATNVFVVPIESFKKV